MAHPRERHTGSATDIVESKIGNPRVHLEKERERLANAASGTENSNLGQLDDGELVLAKEEGLVVRHHEAIARGASSS